LSIVSFSAAKVSVEALATSAAASSAAGKKARKRYKALAAYDKKLKRGKNTVKLKQKLPKKGYRVTIRLKRKTGGYGRPLVLSKG